MDSGAGFEFFLEEDEGFRPSERHVVRLRNVEAYVKKLRDAEEKGAIRVLVVQLFSCLKVRAMQDKPKATLLFDVQNLVPPSAQQGQPHLTAQTPLLMPEYNLPISVNRESKMWIDFFDYAYKRHLREDREELVELVDHFRTETIRELEKRLEQSELPRVDEIADHFLCLDEFGIDRLPDWEPILKQVRRRHEE